ncbi:metallophosphoesterase [Nonomuraea sp. NBC_01738]|uniref:metallophosphoesterase family protein n=1 Tax=Nonomuraea sp. NBC_01738 TaxID=2976003 RepID=UPI002E160DE5|nr:metallophosphoesterase [Nonomuraea sp. NBC_01738]
MSGESPFETPADVPLVTSPMVIMAPRPDGFEAVWSVSRLSRGRLEWRFGGHHGESRMDAFGMTPQGESVLRVRAEHLPTGATVQVRAVTEAVAGPGERHVSDWKTVRLTDPTTARARIAVWNDTHQRDDTIRALDAQTPPVDLLVWNGDLCNDWTTPDQFVRTVLAPAQRDISADRPLDVIIGNHDVRGDWAFRLQEYIGTRAGRPYSAVRIGPVACVFLHTGEDKPDMHPTFHGRVAFEPLRAEQARWLREATTSPGIRDAPYRLVFSHIPLRWTDESAVDYDDGGYDWFSRMSRDAWHDALVAWGAQLAISGHTHEPARIPADAEFPYAQIVAGGPDLDASSSEAATWIEIQADPDSLRLTMRTLDGAVRMSETLEPIAETEAAVPKTSD